MKYFVYLFVLFSSFSLHAQEVLPQFLDNGNAGTEFYLTFLPARPQADDVDNVKIYVLSTVETEVTLEVKAHKFLQKKKTKPNTVTEFILPVTIAQAYSKTETEPSLKEAVYRQQAVHISANDPIIVYGLTRAYLINSWYA
jgi:hypothetical protein